MHWILLLLAIVLEVSGTTCMKLSQGFTRPLPSVLLFVFLILSYVALTLALKKIGLSVSYAIWSGLGMVLIAAIDIVHFKEQISLAQALCIVLIIAGVIGLNLTGATK